MNNNDDQEFIKEADRLIGDSTRNVGLLYDLYKTSMSDSSGDDFQDEIDDLIDKPEYNYDTEADVLGERMDFHAKNSPSFWLGFYKLISKKNKVYNLIISKKKDDDSEVVDLNDVDIFLKGLKVKNYTFKDKVLQWDNLSMDGKKSKGNLKFSGFIENADDSPIKETDYCGPLCEGSIQFSGESEANDVRGKVGVSSVNGAWGDYKEGDPLYFWSGKYNIYFDDNSNKEAAVLTIGRSEEATHAIQLNGEQINNPVYRNGSLSWKGKENKNNSIARLNFSQSPNRQKQVSGKVRLMSSDKAADAVGFQTIVIPPSPPSDTPVVLTTNLPPGKKGEAYNNIAFYAEGGKLPYKWEFKDPKDNWPENQSDQDEPNTYLPKNLEASKAGLISGVPEEVGTYGFNVRVTDSEGKTSDEINIFLKIDDKAASSSVSNEIRPWALPAISAILAFLGIFLGAKLKSHYDEKMRKKTEEAKKANESQKPEIGDFSAAKTAEERAEIIRKEGEYRRKAITEIRDRTFRINDILNQERDAVLEAIDRLDDQIRDAEGEVERELERQRAEKVAEINEIRDRQAEAIRELPPEERGEEVEDPDAAELEVEVH